jgi:hypothetical protein
MGKNKDPDGSGMNIPDHISKSLETIFGLRTVEIVPEVNYFVHFPFAGNTQAPDPLAAKPAASTLCR